MCQLLAVLQVSVGVSLMPLPISTTDMAPEQADTTLTCEELLLGLEDIEFSQENISPIFLVPSPVLRWTHSGINKK